MITNINNLGFIIFLWSPSHSLSTHIAQFRFLLFEMLFIFFTSLLASLLFATGEWALLSHGSYYIPNLLIFEEMPFIVHSALVDALFFSFTTKLLQVGYKSDFIVPDVVDYLQLSDMFSFHWVFIFGLVGRDLVVWVDMGPFHL